MCCGVDSGKIINLDIHLAGTFVESAKKKKKIKDILFGVIWQIVSPRLISVY